MSEPAIDLSQDVESKMLTMTEQANALVINSESTYRAASSFLLGVKALQKEVLDFFAPLKKSAQDAHRKLCAAEKEKAEPLIVVERTVKTRMLAYETAERQRKAEQEAKLRAEARKIEEEARLREATRLESEGRQKEAERLIEAPIFTPPVTVAPPTPKVQGISVRETWACEVDDIRALCRAIADGTAPTSYVTPNMTALNAIARAQKDGFSVPGCRAVASKQVAAGGR